MSARAEAAQKVCGSDAVIPPTWNEISCYIRKIFTTQAQKSRMSQTSGFFSVLHQPCSRDAAAVPMAEAFGTGLHTQ